MRLKSVAASVVIAMAFALTGMSASLTQSQENRGQGVRLRGGQREPEGRYYALVIGNNDYRHLAQLKTAVNDARAVAQALKEQFGFEVRLLLNAERDQIIEALNDYRRVLDAASRLVIYYAGHGHYDESVDKAYWQPVDAKRDSNVKWIIADDITANVKGMSAKQVLIISDSCYSGMMQRLSNSGINPTERRRYLEKMRENTSRTLMSSGSNEPVADGGSGGHSVFAGALLRGLARFEGDEFTAEELFYGYIKESVAGRSEQTPQYNPIRNSGHDSGDFVFRRTEAVSVTAAMHVGFGDGYAEKKMWTEAEAQFKAALRLDPDNAAAHFGLGVVYYNQAKYAEAEAEYKTVIRLNPVYGGVHNNLGVVYYNQAKFERAEEEYKTAIRIDPDSAVTHYNLSVLYYNQANYKEADEAIRAAIRIKPNEAAYKDFLNKVLAKKNDEGKPAADGSVVLRSAQIEVPGTRDWTSTGLIVKRGDVIRISATGVVVIDSLKKISSGPDGLTINDPRKLMPDKPTGSLIAVIGADNDDFFFIGSSLTFTAERNGLLFLSINEGTLSDNQGAFQATVEILKK